MYINYKNKLGCVLLKKKQMCGYHAIYIPINRPEIIIDSYISVIG